jgi:hypothetical protein
MHSQAAEARALQQSREARIAHLEKEALLVGSEARRMAEKLSAEIRSLEQKNAELEIQNLSLRRAVEEASSKIIQVCCKAGSSGAATARSRLLSAMFDSNFFQNEGLRNSLRKTEDMLANAQRKVRPPIGLAPNRFSVHFLPGNRCDGPSSPRRCGHRRPKQRIFERRACSRCCAHAVQFRFISRHFFSRSPRLQLQLRCL